MAASTAATTQNDNVTPSTATTAAMGLITGQPQIIPDSSSAAVGLAAVNLAVVAHLQVQQQTGTTLQTAQQLPSCTGPGITAPQQPVPEQPVPQQQPSLQPVINVANATTTTAMNSVANATDLSTGSCQQLPCACFKSDTNSSTAHCCDR